MGRPGFRVIALLSAVAFLGLLASPAADAATRVPVVFVHGYRGEPSNWATAIAQFEDAGYRQDDLYAFEYDWAQSNEVSAQELAAFVQRVSARTGHAQVDIVNHSMGGLVTRWYLSRLHGAAHVRHVASLAGANHGTSAALACDLDLSCREMMPGSPFLVRLAASGPEAPGPTRYATWYSPCDRAIVPYTSTELPKAANHVLACETHNAYLTDPEVLREVRGFLASPVSPVRGAGR
ncbi:esterase/lipase family protein [Actinomadura rupiterrae]|uniref:esterase/lipase family protein n=1 Tax=Actinomadura rupiterrae TaxID=559627 RepID=UPI0020A57313|nr:triacylglycerol lipase [Actinomadura rupiterrae]MCP2336181.1 triacylglycerol lipase [Actinomadura rupiterrae]